MMKDAFIACLPWIGLVAVAIIVACMLVGISGAKLNLKRLREAHSCQEGSIQSLSFVLTLPVFVMIMMLIVQSSQIMIGNIMVHYAAFASARSAAVWIPSSVNLLETENRISTFELIESNDDGSRYEIFPDGEKYNEIRDAAVLAISPMGPSRSLGYTLSPDCAATAEALARLYGGLDADSNSNALIPTRLANKLAYSDANTDVNLTFWHRWGPYPDYRDPPLQFEYEIQPYPEEYEYNELGWQDHVTATVTYNIPLLPGPVRLFAPAARRGDVSRTDVSGEVYAFLISASATMIIEGEKPLITHWQESF